MSKVVGISLKTKRSWLDMALDQLIQLNDESKVRIALDRHMSEVLPGKQYRDKSIGIVQQIWINIPPERVDLRNRAIALTPRISEEDRLWLHWGMTALAYPFFRDAAEVIGRLFALQDDLSIAQVHDRMLTSWGDRITTKDAIQRLINTLLDWEVLTSTGSKGHFRLTGKATASSADLQLWLLHALLGSSSAEEIELQQLLRLPELYPFTINVGVAALRNYDGFDLHRQGLDMDMIAIRRDRRLPSEEKEKSKRTRKKNVSPGQINLFDGHAENMEADSHTDQSSVIV